MLPAEEAFVEISRPAEEAKKAKKKMSMAKRYGL